MSDASTDPRLPAMPWWRVRMVWLVVAGPLLVVMASFATLALALMNPDPVLMAPQAQAADTSTMPAIAARNHAARPPR